MVTIWESCEFLRFAVAIFLKAALKKAQKEAELEKLRAKAYDKMIDLAEEHFNIPIRKKSGTKQ